MPPLHSTLPIGTQPADAADLPVFHAALLEMLDDSVILTDLEGRILTWNRGATRVFGYAADEMIGRTPAGLYPEESPARFAEDLQRILAGEDFVGEWRGRRRDGTEVWVEIRTILVRSASGHPVGFLGVGRDVTERRRSRAALASGEARLQLAQAAAGFVSWEWAPPASGEVSYTPEFYALHGLSPDHPASSFEEWRDRLLHPQDRDRVLEELQAALRGVRPYDTEYRVVPPDGTVRWIAARGRVLHDESGRAARLVGVSFDVTRRREAEQQLRQLDRMETVARLAGGVAHEANNQMAVVLGAASFILRRDDLPETVRQDATYILEAAERTAAITRQLLAFSRRQVLQPRVLDLNGTIRGFEAILRRTVAQGVELRLDLAQGLERVRIDEGQLQQVLINLALNARDAMPEGGTLTIETSLVLLANPRSVPEGVTIRPGRYIELAVRDTGIGMDRHTLAHIFEPFFTTKGMGRGTGLGLASVYGIVKQSQGYVFGESAPGEGTTMRILLPVATDPLSPSDGGSSADVVGGWETALVVDDEASVLAMMSRALLAAGYTVLAAESGAAALDRARSHAGPVHVLVSDLAMPGMSGRELAARLAELHPEMGVLFVSGFPGEEVERRGLLESGRPFLQKPFAPDELVDRVGRLIDATRRRS